jgi:putative acetyltransferase
VNTHTLVIATATSPDDLVALRSLFQEYATRLSDDLCFQNFEGELDDLPDDYTEPKGALLRARVDGTPAGCCALRPLDTVDYANACEIKRLFVRPEFRRLGLGRQRAEEVMELARMADYDCLLLDTLNDIETARALYQELGFEKIPPYNFNPMEGAHYLKVQL